MVGLENPLFLPAFGLRNYCTPVRSEVCRIPAGNGCRDPREGHAHARSRQAYGRGVEKKERRVWKGNKVFRYLRVFSSKFIFQIRKSKFLASSGFGRKGDPGKNGSGKSDREIFRIRRKLCGDFGEAQERRPEE